MAYVIDENCVACGTCKAGCPVDAISEGDIFVIDPDVCISCGTCAENCPAGAISEGESVITQRNSARPLWRAFFCKGGCHIPNCLPEVFACCREMTIFATNI